MHTYWEGDNGEEATVKGWSGKRLLWGGTFSLSPDVGEGPSMRRVGGTVPGRGKGCTEEEKNLALRGTDDAPTWQERSERGAEQRGDRGRHLSKCAHGSGGGGKPRSGQGVSGVTGAGRLTGCWQENGLEKAGVDAGRPGDRLGQSSSWEKTVAGLGGRREGRIWSIWKLGRQATPTDWR